MFLKPICFIIIHLVLEIGFCIEGSYPVDFTVVGFLPLYLGR
jgi:hypothetical protein